MTEDNNLVFEDESAKQKNYTTTEPWKLLVVDDEEDIHLVTAMVLRNYTFMERDLEVIHAYSAEEAKEMIRTIPEIAVALIDVVMETEHAGLDLVRWVREDARDPAMRLILRTGQPGYAPESTVIIEYDINDYKEKTELTALKLNTIVTTAFRAYSHLKILERNEKGLHQILEASKTLFDVSSVHSFVSGVLAQLTGLLQIDDPSLYVQISGLAVKSENGKFVILAGTGEFTESTGKSLDAINNKSLVELINHAAQIKKCLFKDNYYIGYFKTKLGSENILCLNGGKNLDNVEKDLIRLFSTHISIAFDNIYLNDEIEKTQEEILYTLSEIVETRSKETGFHVKRVGTIAKILGKAVGLAPDRIKLLGYAAPLHDVGKIGIPDTILLKESKLTPDEFEYIKKHTIFGWNILQGSKREILQAAAIIAVQHHEYWDGSGYPHGIRGQDIDIMARIVCVVDVFDALVHRRAYKDAWEYSKAIAFLKEKSGTMFDPGIIDAFLTHRDSILSVQEDHKDSGFGRP